MKRLVLSTIATSLFLLSCAGQTIYREIPADLTTGTDSACIDAWNWLLDEMESSGADRITITNGGWVPIDKRSVSATELRQMLKDELF